MGWFERVKSWFKRRQSPAPALPPSPSVGLLLDFPATLPSQGVTNRMLPSVHGLYLGPAMGDPLYGVSCDQINMLAMHLIGNFPGLGVELYGTRCTYTQTNGMHFRVRFLGGGKDIEININTANWPRPHDDYSLLMGESILQAVFGPSHPLPAGPQPAAVTEFDAARAQAAVEQADREFGDH